MVLLFYVTLGFPGGASDKESACQCRRHKRLGFNPWVGKIPWSRKWQSTPAFLPVEFHGQRSLAGYRLWGCKELDMTEHTHTCYIYYLLLCCAACVKNPRANAGEVGDVGSVPGCGRSPGGGHSNSLQYSWLENPMDKEAGGATVHGTAKSWTQQSNSACTHMLHGRS